MRTIIATGLIALGLLMSAVVIADAGPYDGYPEWAKQAFEHAERGGQ